MFYLLRKIYWGLSEYNVFKTTTFSVVYHLKPNFIGFEDWPFLSVHFWGEDPTGEWFLGNPFINLF